MASIAREKNGTRRILFVAPDGERRQFRLGKVSQRTAEGMKCRVEQLLESLNFKRPMEPNLAQWVMDLEPPMAKKLARVGLIPDPEPKPSATLNAFIEGYISRRNDVSPHTRRIWRQTLRLLSGHFGADKPLGDITRGDAADWRLSLVAAKMADASVRKHCGFAKHFFAQAVDRELVAVNPFAKLVSAPVGNAARQYFVTREETAKILDAAPDAEWRLIIAMSRYGGLRCPSEHLALAWADVDWERNRITVRSPKTARHAGHESRIVPLFPELRPYLEAVFDAAAPGSEFVIERYRDPNANLRTQLERIIRRAGLKPWPRITHNLRASRATELAADYPAHVAAAWLGHSTLVAQKHYWTVTDGDFERAIQSGAESGARSAQNAAQRACAPNRNESNEQSATVCVVSTSAKFCDTPLTGAKKMAEVHGNRTHLRRA
ncbi:MAG: integrase [Planctomycetota bacterium]|nr:MAG: integrase [Planctomycetota bacterium]